MAEIKWAYSITNVKNENLGLSSVTDRGRLGPTLAMTTPPPTNIVYN
jgi:hypothetical protein